ncbi:hypothetical protein [Roseivivax sediminis]|uniref:Uncharacterized protein n=1 Tax=Roseivivax sediminis TaxID=936889 RepID=A0A1I1UR54_9RHOB|nr:hypothetical protein [Roseivivax sediminis]SFD71283.1 hypothetical protein SAMN04515678_102394 [Roseivivax sediminis]
MSPERTPHPEFRTRQAMADLDALIRAGRPDLPARIAARIPVETGAADALDAIRTGADPVSVPTGAGDALRLAAATPDDDFGAFIWASAILVRGALAGSGLGPELAEYWDALADHYRIAPAAQRAALANGIDRLAAGSGLDLDSAPGPRDRLTRPRSAVMPPLVALARRMPPGLRDEVAAPGRAAIETALAVPDAWFEDPGEDLPVDPARLSAEPPDAPGFAPCVALLILGGTVNAAARAGAAQLWSGRSAAILALDRSDRAAILGGLRWLYESDPDWTAEGAVTLPLD